MGPRSSARSRLAGALTCCFPLLALIVAACALGSSADPEASGNPGAAQLEASTRAPSGDGSDDPELDPDDGGAPADGSSGPTPECLAAIDEALWNFEDSDQGWTHKVSDNAQGGPAWPYDPWTRGPAAASSIACPSGNCWGAELAQNYAQCQRGELVSPRIDMTACAGQKVSLIFTHAYAFWTGSYGGQTWFDGGIVELSSDDGSSWQLATATFPGTVRINPNRTPSFQCHLPNAFHVHDKAGFTGAQPTPSSFEIAIPTNYLTKYLRVRFSQGSGVSSSTTNATTSRAATAAGWRIDDVRLALK